MKLTIRMDIEYVDIVRDFSIPWWNVSPSRIIQRDPPPFMNLPQFTADWGGKFYEYLY